MAGKPKPHPAPDDVRQTPKAKTLAEALDEMGFKPPDPPRGIILRRCGSARRLSRWRKPEGQE